MNTGKNIKHWKRARAAGDVSRRSRPAVSTSSPSARSLRPFYREPLRNAPRRSEGRGRWHRGDDQAGIANVAAGQGQPGGPSLRCARAPVSSRPSSSMRSRSPRSNGWWRRITRQASSPFSTATATGTHAAPVPGVAPGRLRVELDGASNIRKAPGVLADHLVKGDVRAQCCPGREGRGGDLLPGVGSINGPGRRASSGLRVRVPIICEGRERGGADQRGASLEGFKRLRRRKASEEDRQECGDLTLSDCERAKNRAGAEPEAHPSA